MQPRIPEAMLAATLLEPGMIIEELLLAERLSINIIRSRILPNFCEAGHWSSIFPVNGGKRKYRYGCSSISYHIR